MELLTQNEELFDYKGEPIIIFPVVSNKIVDGFGLFCKEILLGKFESFISAINEAEYIQDMYVCPYQVGTYEELEDEEEFLEWLNGENENDSDENEDC